MSDFIAGFASRLDDAARELALSFADVDEGFSPRDIKARAGGRPRQPASAEAPVPEGPVHFSPQPVGAKFRKPKEAEPEETPEPVATVTPDVFADPIAAARATAYAEGYRDAHEQAALEHARDQAMLQQLGEALKSTDRIDRDLLASQLRQTVMFLVSKMVRETGIAADLLVSRIEAATDLIVDNAEAAVLRLNPEDMPLVKDHLPALVQPVGDAEIARGSFIIESPATIVEDGPELWLEQLAQAIDRVGVPPLC